MRHRLRVAWAIARRDYVAAVFSRLFLIFLLLPLVAAAIGGAFGSIGGGQGADAPARAPVVAVTASALPRLEAARGRLAAVVGDDTLPRLVARGPATARLDGTRLRLSADAPDTLREDVALILAEARTPGSAAALAVSRAPAPTARPPAVSRVELARGVQYVALILTIMLAGRLLANFIEERGNKVIEVLAAAAPVDAIFLGKLIGMLLFSFTCIAAWAAAAALFVGWTMPGTLGAIASPAVGWPGFAILSLLYFAADYLLFGTILLGLGAHARTPADVQTLALPTTIAQFALFGLAAAHVGEPDHPVAIAASLLPWSAPLALAARAAERPEWWPHLLGLGWQALWLWASIRFAAARFRRAILGSAR